MACAQNDEKIGIIDRIHDFGPSLFLGFWGLNCSFRRKNGHRVSLHALLNSTSVTQEICFSREILFQFYVHIEHMEGIHNNSFGRGVLNFFWYAL